MTVRRMVMHHNIKFGNKIYSSLENIIWTNTDILTLCCDLDLECSNPIFSQDTLAYVVMMMYHQTKFGCQSISSSEDIVKKKK